MNTQSAFDFAQRYVHLTDRINFFTTHSVLGAIALGNLACQAGKATRKALHNRFNPQPTEQAEMIDNTPAAEMIVDTTATEAQEELTSDRFFIDENGIEKAPAPHAWDTEFGPHLIFEADENGIEKAPAPTNWGVEFGPVAPPTPPKKRGGRPKKITAEALAI